MTGGMAFVYDPDEVLAERVNPDQVIFQRIESEHLETVLKELVARLEHPVTLAAEAERRG